MQYHAYQARDSQRTGDPIAIEAADDAAAIDLAGRFLNGDELQLWQGDRLVVTLNAAHCRDDRSDSAPQMKQT
ncbi:MAG: hypothetical protein K2Y27_15900 [Xanthobacteraceae bacterium]|nr:hypothetical protein [Xanthobacteraceae bacterium]